MLLCNLVLIFFTAYEALALKSPGRLFVRLRHTHMWEDDIKMDFG
jgi:hypothetical protein